MNPDARRGRGGLVRRLRHGQLPREPREHAGRYDQSVAQETDAVTAGVMTEQEKYMKAALKLAHRAAEEGEVPVGAVVVCKEKIIARARNERETSGDPTAHAEVLALRRAAEALL